MYIQSIISSRDGFAKLQKRSFASDGLGSYQPELPSFEDKSAVFESLTQAIRRFDISATRVDHASVMDMLSSAKKPEEIGRLTLGPNNSSRCRLGKKRGTVEIEWSASNLPRDGQLAGISAVEANLIAPTGLLPSIGQAWRDLFPRWYDTSTLASTPTSLEASLGNIGLVKDGVAVNLMLGRTMIDTWLFQRVPVAMRRGVISLAVGVFLQGPRDNRYYLSRILRTASSAIQRAEANLKELQPISLEVPFVLIGLWTTPVTAPRFLELETDPLAAKSNPVIERVIEVPVQYQQAVLGILGYFGTYLQQIAPEQAAASTIRIEQGAGYLRLVIEGENGSRQILERAFEDYQDIVRGDMPIENLPLSPFAAAELRNELRLAHTRIEFQRDMLTAQGLELKTLRELSLGLANRSAPAINLHVSNVAQASSSMPIDLGELLKELSELASQLDREDETQEIARNLAAVGRSIEGAGQTPGGLVTPMRHLRAILDGLQSGGSKLSGALEKAAGAAEAAQKLARRYNSIAEWCGLPQIPRAIAG